MVAPKTLSAIQTLARTKVLLNSKAHQLGWLKTKYAEFGNLCSAWIIIAFVLVVIFKQTILIQEFSQSFALIKL